MSGAFVFTKAAKDAVRGQGGYVLNALGIDWQRGRPHITCPFHGGKNDFRWDDQAEKWFCTCGTGSVFDAIMECEGLGTGREAFDAAKIRAMEIIDRTDLIRHKGYKQQASGKLFSP